MGEKESNLVIKAVGGNIRTLRKAEKLSQRKFAAMIGISRNYLSQIEHGQVNTSLGKLTDIANGLDVPLPNLLFGLEEHTPSKLSKESVYAVVKIPDADQKSKRKHSKRGKTK